MKADSIAATVYYEVDMDAEQSLAFSVSAPLREDMRKVIIEVATTHRADVVVIFDNEGDEVERFNLSELAVQ